MLSIPVLNAAGAPFTVTGWTVDAKIKDGSGGVTLYTWNSLNIAATGTNVVLTILPATSFGWTFEGGWYRVAIQHPSDATQRYRILEGLFILSDD